MKRLRSAGLEQHASHPVFTVASMLLGVKKTALWNQLQLARQHGVLSRPHSLLGSLLGPHSLLGSADAGCVLNGKIYLAGAHGLAAFDPTSQQWGAPTRPPLPAVAAGFSSPAVAAHRGAIWIIGGSGSTEVWSFNPDSDEWAAGPSLPTSLAWGAAWSVITEHCAK